MLLFVLFCTISTQTAVGVTLAKGFVGRAPEEFKIQTARQGQGRIQVPIGSVI
jgi:hypothetical protein